LAVYQVKTVGFGLEEHLGAFELHVGALNGWVVFLSLGKELVLDLKLVVFALPELGISLALLVGLELIIDISHFTL